MLTQIRAAQADLDQLLSQLGSAGGAVAAQGEAQRQLLARLERNLAGGTAVPHGSLRNEIAAAIAVTASLGQQAQVTADRRVAAELAAVSAVSRNQVQSLMRDMHRFDPYLRFESPDEEDAYRRREAERSAYIEQQHRRGTPEGDLNASAAAVGQMVDAEAQGAGDSPEFRERWNELLGTTARLRAAVQRSGGSTREFDERLRAELRETLRRRGIPEAEIEARLAAHPENPLEAARVYMRDAEDIRQIERSANRAGASNAQIVAAETPPQDLTMSDAIGRLRAAGATALADHPSTSAFAHGVTTNERPASPAGPSLPT